MKLISEHSALHIIDISPEDRELLLAVFKYFTNRWSNKYSWSNTQQMDANILQNWSEAPSSRMTAIDALAVQLEEMANVSN